MAAGAFGGVDAPLAPLLCFPRHASIQARASDALFVASTAAARRGRRVRVAGRLAARAGLTAAT
eukprot:CAMPEP_0168623448 /NCGR_PEP_ID=MMETSP0449_2-20121227/8834_1 /TAXON_ID=1082188 /ORGANISM="Strombidium rassoulzadegani, Strain ras09" /LENGTH=63 /DNA_ID=CAMNT_0008664837 /DNA_START=169 /DNA_END=360 /DNA_ORIENTATION=-